jgi:hypothetical protein
MTARGLDGATCKPRPREGLTSEVLDDEMVVYDGASRTLHHLNRAATLVWLYCDGEHTIDSISEKLANESVTAPDAIRRDVVALVQELDAASLLVLDD